MLGFLLRMARAIVHRVLAQLTQQLNVVRQQAYRPMRVMARQVAGGSIWRGKGADAFVEEVQSLLMPHTRHVANHITLFHRHLGHAVETIDRADKQVQKLATGLGDLFKGVY